MCPKLRVLQVIPYLSPAFGGSVSVLRQLATELAKKGHDVTIITSDFRFDKRYSAAIEESGVKVISFRTTANLGLFIHTPSINTWLRKNIRNFDIIHMHNFRSCQNSSVCHFAKKNKIPYIIQAHGSVLPFFEKQGLKRLFDLVWGKKILQNASKAIALTDTEVEQYLSMGVPKSRIQIIPNGLDLSEFTHIPPRGEFRSRYGISENEKILLFLGRIHKIKGIDLLINAYAELVKETGDVRLVIAGPDDKFLSVITEQIDYLKLPKKPLFTGPLYGQDKLSAYVDADIFVLPSRYEALPMTLLEAMICGTPVIISDNCGCGRILKDTGSGSIMNFSHIQDFIQEVSRILNNPFAAKKVALDGQQYVRDNFSWDRIIHDFEVVYEECGSDEKTL